MKAITRIIVITITLFLLIINAGCAVIHSKTRGQETKTRIKTHTTGYLLLIPIYSNETIINKRVEKSVEK